LGAFTSLAANFHYAIQMDPTDEALEIIRETPHLVEAVIMSPELLTGGSPWLLGLVIFALSFFIEETAIAASAYFVGTQRLPFPSAFGYLYAGIFVSDFFLYGLGVLIRRNRWIRRHVDIPYYQSQASRWLQRGLPVAIVVARLVPGMLIPIFIMLGITGSNLSKIGLVNLVVTGIYTLGALFLLYRLGLSVSDLLGIEVLLSAAALLVFYLLRQEVWSAIKVRWHLLFSARAKPWPASTHKGLPPLRAPRRLTFSETLPYWMVYTPVWIYYFFNVLRFQSWLAPAAVNPGIENSGLCGESKSAILHALQRECAGYLPKFTTVMASAEPSQQDLLAAMSAAGLHFPLIAKPDIGYMSRGVQLIKGPEALCQYFDNFPNDELVILQEFIAQAPEAGIYYTCFPSKPNEYEIDLALTYFPFVVGDGRSRLIELVMGDPRFAHFFSVFDLSERGESIPRDGEVIQLKISGSTRDGSIHMAYSLPKNSPLAAAIHRISKSIPGFWLGRFDVKFKDMNALLSGEFKILELNGAAGENLSAWDPTKSFIYCYKKLFTQMRRLFEIGSYNRTCGFATISARQLFKAYLAQESILFRIARSKKKD